MNKRIEELKAKAHAWCDRNVPIQWRESDGYGEAWEDKFAELIVQECAEQLCHPKFRKSTDENKVLVGQGLILNHFGIEE